MKCVPSVSRITGSAKWVPSSPGSISGVVKLSLKVSSSGGLTTSNKISVTLPKGLFRQTVSNVSISASGGGEGTLNGDIIDITPTANVENSGNIPEITIKNLSLTNGYSSMPKSIKVRSTADTNESGIEIKEIV
jgi:hypothetical protein